MTKGDKVFVVAAAMLLAGIACLVGPVMAAIGLYGGEEYFDQIQGKGDGDLLEYGDLPGWTIINGVQDPDPSVGIFLDTSVGPLLADSFRKIESAHNIYISKSIYSSSVLELSSGGVIAREFEYTFWIALDAPPTSGTSTARLRFPNVSGSNEIEVRFLSNRKDIEFRLKSGLTIDGGDWRWSPGGSTYNDNDYEVGKWIKFAVYVQTSSTSEGIIEFRMDDVLVNTFPVRQDFGEELLDHYFRLRVGSGNTLGNGAMYLDDLEVDVIDSGETPCSPAQMPDPVLPPPLPGQEVLYAKVVLDTDCPDEGLYLVRVDHLLTPGVSDVIGNIGFNSIACMDFDPDGVFFAVGKPLAGGGKVLITIDPVTGDGIPIGGPTTGISPSMASDSQGNLYGCDGSHDALYSMDRATGLTTLVGPLGWDTRHQGMDFSPDDTLYLLTQSDGGLHPALLTVDTVTGAATNVVEFTVDFGNGPESLMYRTAGYDVSFSVDGTLYATVGIDGPTWLLTIDLETGVGTPLGIAEVQDPNGGGYSVSASSIAFGPASWANVFPVAVIDAPSQVEATSPDGAEVTLDGSGSYDPDSNDVLTFEWKDAENVSLGSEAILTLVLGLGNNHAISLSVTDSGPKTGSETAYVDVVDTTPPVITLNGEAEVTLECGVDTYTELGASAYDIVDQNVSVVISGDAVDASTVGTYTVTYDAADASGNQATQVTRTVTVADTTPPDVSVLSNPDCLWPPNHKMHEVVCTLAIVDAGDDEPTVQLVSITSSESDNGYGTGDGNTSNDIQVDSEGRIFLRAERQGTNTGRIYTISYTVTDASGNSTDVSCEIDVPHDSSAHTCDNPDCDLNGSN